MNLGPWSSTRPTEVRFGPRRAGGWARDKARRDRFNFARAHWGVLLSTFAVGLAVTCLTALLPNWPRQFAAGAWVASVVASLVFVVYQGSGTMHLDSGADAERWTAEELERSRETGWRIMNRVAVKNYDVDYVAVGPGGVLVVETKWTGDERVLDQTSAKVRDAVMQVEGNGRTIGNWFRNIEGPIEVRTAVVYWGPRLHADVNRGPHRVGNTMVLSGNHVGSLFTTDAEKASSGRGRKMLGETFRVCRSAI